LEFGSQLKLVRESFAHSPTTLQAGFVQLVKGAELMIHQHELMAARNKELEEQMAVITKRKTRKRKRLQYSGILEYGEAADQVAASASLPAKAPKKACGGAAAEGATATQRRCSNCGRTGHNARTCQAGAAEDSESSASTQFILSDSGGDNNDD
jgi:hypothetical protein